MKIKKLIILSKEEFEKTKEKEKEKAIQLDQFFTKKEVALECLNILFETLGNTDEKIFIEPSAGNGSFYKFLKEKLVIGIEIDPYMCKNTKYINKDFLSLKPENIISDFKEKKKNIIIVGNPPFGKNSSKAINFFNHSTSFGDTIAMILPSTFKKVSIINKLDDNFSLIKSVDLSPNSFTFLNDSYSVNCVFQIWKREKNKRKKIILPMKHKDFKFLKFEEITSEDTDIITIQRVGARAGQIMSKESNKNSKNYYYIKPLVPGVLEKFKLLNLEKREEKLNTTSYPSLAKTELVELYSNLI